MGSRHCPAISPLRVNPSNPRVYSRQLLVYDHKGVGVEVNMAIPEWAHLGAEVMCVKAFPPTLGLPNQSPVVGKTYTIRAIVVNRARVGIRVVEIMNPDFPYSEGML